MEKLVHIVYIHGFQGNDTSFQSFPLHLQEKLSSKISPNSGIRFQSSLYPTYKSVKPISYATKNFLQWLATQPDGPVIVVGHSMGGLLAADAATDPSNRGGDHSGSGRIVGVIAFDTPFLGMHPHVVVSGIVSLLPKEKEGNGETERQLNQHPQIQIVDEETADEWEDFKKEQDRKAKVHSQVVENSLTVPSSPTASSSINPHQLEKTRSSSQLFNKTVDFLASRSKQENSLVRWLRKHADSPFSAGSRWVTERFQFGSSMFDPSGLKDRYSNLVEWNGLWVNYWTYTTEPDDRKAAGTTAEQDEAEQVANDIALLDSGIAESIQSESSGSSNNSKPTTQQNMKAEKKQRQSALKEKPSIRHFVVLPTGLARVLGGWEKWERVEIAGVDDEVAGHTGLFIPQQNLDYTNFVDRVADKVLAWCKQL